MRALIYDGPRSLRVDELPRPTPGAGEVAVRVGAVGICGSDVHGYTGANKRREPGMVMGHEFAGEIVEVGPDVPRERVGMRVAVNPTVGCGACPACRDGAPNRCVDRRTVGVNMGTVGAFAEIVTVPWPNVVPLSDATSYDAAAMAEPLAVGLHAVNLAGCRPGGSLLVVGGGTIGLCIVLAARRRDATIYLAEPMPARRQLARELGAVPLETEGESIPEAVRRLSPDGVEAAIDAVGLSPTLNTALGSVAYGGTVVWVGNHEPAVEVACNAVVNGERMLRGSYAYTNDEYREAVELINRRAVDVDLLIGERADLAAAPSLFAALAEGRNASIKVVVHP
jgi:2-desacetyl-2-hydroxyethyl bacteriochlorophyllide A dehydrogenase